MRWWYCIKMVRSVALRRFLMCSVSVLTFTMSGAAYANPEGASVVGGSATIEASGKKLDIHQHTDRAVIDWRSFNINVDEHTQFHQPSSSAVALNRVSSADPSHIMGKLSANGNVVLINPNGVFFGKDSKVDVNGLIATTSDIDNDSFMMGDRLRFNKQGRADAAIINAGHITAKEAGLVALVAPNVANHGIIEAKMGRVELASGDSVMADLYGDGLYELKVSDGVASQIVSNTGSITAEGGTIAITAAAGKEIINSLVTIKGELKAPSISQKNGKIIIGAAGSNAVKGNRDEDKGKKQGSSNVVIADAYLDVSGRKAGESGGSIEITGDNVALLNGTLIDASGHTGKSGTIKDKKISDAREGSAGGDIKIGGDYLGQGDAATARNLYVDESALILNDSLHEGDAGRTIFWSDDTTQFYGNVYARALGGKDVDALTWNTTAGGNAGDGGFVETSGKKHLDAGGYVDLTASNGARGTYFLDPTNITIYGNFTPTDIANGVMWLDASQLTGYNNGDTVSLWTDVFGLNSVSAFGTGPTYVSNAVNGLPALRFTGNNGMRTSNNLSFNDWSMFVAFKNVAGATSYERLLDHDYINGFWFGRNAATASSFGGGVKESGSPYGRFVTVTDGQWNLIGNQRAATSHTIWANGNFSGGSTGAVNGTATTSNRVGVGMWHNNGTPGQQAENIDFSEVLIYGDDLTSDQRNLVEQYQSAKWGIALTPPGTGADEVAKATASDGYSAFTTRYLERLSQSANVSLQATSNITLDLKGDTLSLANDRNISLTATGGNITDVSAGTIRTTRTGSGGNISITATAGSINLDTTNLEAMGGGVVNLTSGGNTSLTQTSNLKLGAVKAANVSLSSSGTIDGLGGVSSSGGDISISAGNDLDLTNIGLRSNNGNISLSAGRDATFSASTNAGTGNLSVTAVRDIFFTSATNLTSNMVGYWNFDEGSGVTAADSSGSSNNGTLTNGPTWSGTTPFGTSGNFSLSFDGTNDFVSIADSNSLDITNAFTLSVWMQSANTGQTNRYLISKRNDAGSDNVYSMLYGYSSGNVQYYAAGNGFGYPSSNSNLSANDTNWHLMTYAYDGSTYKAYRDGILINSMALVSNAVSSTSNLLLGSFNGAGYFYNGLMDDVRIYNTALSANNVGRLYAYTPGLIANTVSLNAGRDITLNASLTATGAGTPLMLVAGRDFINNAGAGALSASSGRWLVYNGNASSATITKGGLTGFNRYGCTYNAGTPSCAVGTDTPASGNGFYFAYAPTLSLSGLTGNNKTYDGSLAASVSGGGALSGVLYSDAVTLNSAGATFNFGNKNVGTAKPIAASGYALSGVNHGYLLSQPTGLTGDITKAPLTVSLLNSAPSLQVGEANPSFDLVYSGFQGLEGVGDLGVLPTASTLATSSSLAGLYDITIAGGSDTNYDFSYTNPAGTLTLTALPSSENSSSFLLPNTVIIVSQNPLVSLGNTGSTNSVGMNDKTSSEENNNVSETGADDTSSNEEGDQQGTTQAKSKIQKILRGLVEIHPALVKLFGLENNDLHKNGRAL